MATNANDLFTRAFDKIQKEIPFDMKWSNGTGYFDKAVYGEHAPVLGKGEIAKSSTPGNRRIIIIGTRLGNVCVFDRYDCKGERDNDNVFVYNATKAIDSTCLLRNTRLDYTDMSIALGEFDVKENIGWLLEQTYSAMKKAA